MIVGFKIHIGSLQKIFLDSSHEFELCELFFQGCSFEMDPGLHSGVKEGENCQKLNFWVH